MKEISDWSKIIDQIEVEKAPLITSIIENIFELIDGSKITILILDGFDNIKIGLGGILLYIFRCPTIVIEYPFCC